MKELKGVLIVLSGLFIFITLVSLLIPSTVRTVRSVEVSAAAGNVFDKIEDLKNWNQWHPVFMADSTTIVFSEPSRGVGAYVTWSTNGKGNKLQITGNDSTHITAMLIRKGEKDVMNIIGVRPIGESNGAEVEWKVVTKLKWYPWEKFYGIFLDKITGPGFELALNNLKSLSEDSN